MKAGWELGNQVRGNLGIDPPTPHLVSRPLSSFHTASDEELGGSLGMRLKGTIDGLQMSIKCPTSGGQTSGGQTSGGQTRNQEAAIQQTFHLERSSFFYLSVIVIRA